MLDIPDLERAVELLKKAKTLALACHVGPDGDALGAMLGMAVAARAAGIEVWPSFGEPFVVPEMYSFLPVDLLVRPAEIPAKPETMMSFDAGSMDRLGGLAKPASLATTLIVVDHHITNSGFGHLNLIVPTAAATAEVVYHLLVALDWPIDSVVATCLHTGIVTDTGRFQYSNTSPGTLETAARLVATGARPEVIGQHVYEEVPFGYMALAAAVFSRAKLDRERRLVWSVLEADDLASAGLAIEETDSLMDTIRTAKESDVAMLVKHLDSGRVKVSLRSRGRVDVAAIAREFGGGGHHNAAGFTVNAEPDDVIEEVRSRLEVVGNHPAETTDV